MLKIRVANIQDTSDGVYIGRAYRNWDESPLGNPYQIGPDGDRATVIKKYRRWLWVKIRSQDPDVLRELGCLSYLARTKGCTLLCWCAPKPCHGDVIKSALEWMYETSQGE